MKPANQPANPKAAVSMVECETPGCNVRLLEQRVAVGHTLCARCLAAQRRRHEKQT